METEKFQRFLAKLCQFVVENVNRRNFYLN